jgi:hypothetical protein
MSLGDVDPDQSNIPMIAVIGIVIDHAKIENMNRLAASDDGLSPPKPYCDEERRSCYV